MAVMAATILMNRTKNPNDLRFHEFHAVCEARSFERLPPVSPSWFRRQVLGSLGVSLPTPRLLTPSDPALKLPKRCIAQRQKDEARMLRVMERAKHMKGKPQELKKLGEELFEVTYGKGVTAQIREDFLIQYGCTGWTKEVLETMVQLCESRGIIEIGAGHGQWCRAILDTYDRLVHKGIKDKKRFEFVLAYDDMSSLPLNTHIYNKYTKPHHEYFGKVKKLESQTDTTKILQSWACRGRALLMVYPPPGDMAVSVVENYANAAPENDTVIYVGEGRGGANGSDSLFDFFESGDWILLKEMKVLPPPGDKGHEKLYILQRVAPAK